MLDGSALEPLEMLGPRVSAATKAGVDAVDDMAGFKFSFKEGDAVVNKLEIPLVVGKPGLGVVSNVIKAWVRVRLRIRYARTLYLQ